MWIMVGVKLDFQPFWESGGGGAVASWLARSTPERAPDGPLGPNTDFTFTFGSLVGYPLLGQGTQAHKTAGHPAVGWTAREAADIT